MRSAPDTTARHREIIHSLAVESFARHRLTDLGAAGDTRVFRCARADSGMYSFRVVVWPCWIVVAGDIGDTLFSHSDRDTIGWLRGAQRDVDYMLGKVRGARKVFMEGDAEAFLGRMETDFDDGDDADPERAEKIRDGWRAGDDSPESFHRACRDADVDEPPSCTDYESDHVWAVEALRWFIAAFDAEQAIRPQP